MRAWALGYGFPLGRGKTRGSAHRAEERISGRESPASGESVGGRPQLARGLHLFEDDPGSAAASDDEPSGLVAK